MKKWHLRRRVTRLFKLPWLGRRTISPLKTELKNLRHNYARDENRLDELSSDFWANGGTCCPSCGVPGFSKLCDKQERRTARMRYLEQKLVTRSSR